MSALHILAGAAVAVAALLPGHARGETPDAKTDGAVARHASEPAREAPAILGIGDVAPGAAFGRQAEASARRVPSDVDADADRPGEVERLFDAYTLVQAQEQLALDDDQLGRFLPRFRELVRVRRRHLRDRAQLLAQLSRRLRERSPDEAAIGRQLDLIARRDADGATAERAAREAVVATLGAIQRARFLVFEEAMERRKADLMAQAREGRRARARTR